MPSRPASPPWMNWRAKTSVIIIYSCPFMNLRSFVGYELEDLNSVMTRLNLSAKQRFNMFVDFVENRIDPGATSAI